MIKNTDGKNGRPSQKTFLVARPNRILPTAACELCKLDYNYYYDEWIINILTPKKEGEYSGFLTNLNS